MSIRLDSSTPNLSVQEKGQIVEALNQLPESEYDLIAAISESDDLSPALHGALIVVLVNLMNDVERLKTQLERAIQYRGW